MKEVTTTSTAASVAVLHVDDSAADRYRRRRALESAGFRVADAETGAVARVAFAAGPADLVLLDVRLPDVTGFELARDIKAQAALTHRDVAVVLISAQLTESEYRVQGLESGADAYLIEPITDAELVATLRAVSRRLDDVKAARRNERLLDALFEYIPEGITVADAPDVTIRRVSRFGLALTGRSPETLVGISADDHPGKWSIFHTDGVTPASSDDLPLTRAVRSGAVVTDEEWLLRRADGTLVTLLCNAGPIHDLDGRVTGGVIAWRDITARKDVEDALRQRTDDLRLADRTKNEFLATVVHELRQPIQAALAALAVMKSRASRRAGERARDVLERQLEQITRISEDLLDATRVVRGQVTLDIQPHDLCMIVRHALETSRPAFSERKVQVISELPDTPIPVRADAGRLQQVIVNVLSNAARYTPAGGRAEVEVSVSGSTATIRVRDTGDGIAPEYLARVFNLFARGSTQAGGFGIGLAVARSLVEAHGGTIHALSEGPGKGSEFTITVPNE